MSEVSDTLRAARKLIEKPENWCKGANAATATGEIVTPDHPDAHAMCVQGAVKAIAGDYVFRRSIMFRLISVLPYGFESAVAFNDHPDTTHPMVLDLFDRAIEMEEADG